MEARLYTKYNDKTLIADLANSMTAGKYGSRIHGGWDKCEITIGGLYQDLFQYLRSESQPGRFFTHLEITEGPSIRWEGRLMSARLQTGVGSLQQSVLWSRNKGTYWTGSAAGSERTNTNWPSAWPTRDMTVTVPSGTTAGRANNAVDRMLTDRVKPQVQARLGLGETQTTGSLSLSFMGYWSSGHDQKVAVIDYSSGTRTADAIIKAILTAECPDISSDQTQISVMAGNINLTLEARTYANDHIKALANIGDSSGNSYFFGVYDNRIPILTQIAPLVVDWDLDVFTGISYPVSSRAKMRGGGLGSIRAQDVVRLNGIIGGADVTPTAQSISTFVVYQTTYDMLRGTVEIVPDAPANTASVLLARQGVEQTS